jgi:transposase, IS6 family
MDGRRRAGVGGQNCDGALLTARPLSGHAHPVRRQQAPPQARADRSVPRHSRQLRCGSDHGPGWHAGDPHIQTRTWGWHTPILTVALVDDSFGQAELMRRRRRRVPPAQSGFAGFRFPREVIMLAVRWYLRYGLSYRDVEELLAERGITVDHVTIYRWVQRFTPLVIDAARPCQHAPGNRWFAEETYLKVAGRWVYLYRAIDQFGQVIDVLMSQKRDLAATRRFFTRALQHGSRPAEVTTDRATAYPRVLDDLVPAACHVRKKYANNPIESDHSRLKSRLRPMRGLKQLRCARVISAGHAFIQNIRRGHYELGTEDIANLRVLAAFTELTLAI